jgi:hypothetical protein
MILNIISREFLIEWMNEMIERMQEWIAFGRIKKEKTSPEK